MIGLEGATCNTALIPEMEEIGANILLAEHIGRALVVGSEPADRLDVDVPGPLGKAGKPHVVDHTLTQRGHGRSPFGFKRQDLCPGTDQIPQHAVLNDYAFYGEAVQSNRRRGAEAAEAREEIPHVSKRTTNWIDSNVEILFMALVKVIEDARDDAERFTENGKVGSRRRATFGRALAKSIGNGFGAATTPLQEQAFQADLDQCHEQDFDVFIR